MTGNARKNEWDRENMRTLSCRLRKEEAERFRKFAEYLGTTPHALLSEYVKRCLELDEKVRPEERAMSSDLQNRILELERRLRLALLEIDAARDRAVHAEKIVDEYLRGR